MDSKGNGHNSIDLEHLSEEGFKELFPGASAQPLISGNIGETNAGVRLLANDESPLAMLRTFNFKNDTEAALCNAALSENNMFLYNKDGKVNKEVQSKQESIKGRASAQCSVNGLMIDQYKQSAIGVATSTSTPKGWQPLSIPGFKKYNEGFDGNNRQSPNNKRP
jgi:hypothetical protein